MTNDSLRCIARAAVLATLPLIAGCALMGGGGKPFALYQFGNGADAEPVAQMAIQQPIVMIYPGSTFDRQSSGDRIVTATGNEVAYIAEARWVAPAQELFDAAAIRHIENLSPQVRVIRAGAPTKADYMLAIDVREFEASYPGGSGTAPEVIVHARAKLMRVADRTIIGDWPVVQRENAQENRVTAIVAAFDRASNAVTTQIAGNVRQALGAT